MLGCLGLNAQKLHTRVLPDSSGWWCRRGGSLGRLLFSRLTCILAPVSLCCCRLYGSHPAGIGGREDLWGCAFGSSRSGTTAMLKSFCCFIPWCPNLSSSPHLEQPLLTKLQQQKAIYKMSKWSQFGSQDTPKLPGCEELSSGALQEVTSPAPVTKVRTSTWTHVPSSGGVPVLNGERGCSSSRAVSLSGVVKITQEGLQADVVPAPLLPRLCSADISCGEMFKLSCSAVCPAFVRKQLLKA